MEKLQWDLQDMEKVSIADNHSRNTNYFQEWFLHTFSLHYWCKGIHYSSVDLATYSIEVSIQH